MVTLAKIFDCFQNPLKQHKVFFNCHEKLDTHFVKRRVICFSCSLLSVISGFHLTLRLQRNKKFKNVLSQFIKMKRNCLGVPNAIRPGKELQLIADYYSDPKVAEYFKRLDIYIYPCLNPDGYEYTRSNPGDPSVKFCVYFDRF